MSSKCAPTTSATAKALGVRLIAVDRPGIGDSSPQRDRTLRRWADDIGAISDALNLRRFGVLGWSAGGPHALACAAFLVDQVSITGLVACAPPFDDRALARIMPREPRWLARLARSVPFVLDFAFTDHCRKLRRNPDAVIKSAMASLCPADRDAIIDPFHLDHLRASMIAACAAGPRGIVDDVKALIKPWGFEVNSIASIVCHWHGAADTIIPQAVGRALAGRFRQSAVELLPGEGHFLYLRRWKEILERLVKNWAD